MDGRFKEISWEFWLGSGFVGVAVVILVPALVLEKWRDVVSGLGPSIAAFAVVGAAFIAYAGAIAKVRFDWAEASREKTALRRTALLKLELACYELDETIRGMIPNLKFDEINSILGTPFVPQHFRLTEPDGITRAWEHLDVLPAEIAGELREIRVAINETGRLLDGIQAYPRFDRDWTNGQKSAIVKQLTRARDAGHVIQKLIHPEIDAVAPELYGAQNMLWAQREHH